MEIKREDKTIRDTIIHGHILDVLKQLPDECVNTVITSPPYYGLRSYQTKPQAWGGNASCNHVWESVGPRRERSPEDIKDMSSKQATVSASAFHATYTNICSQCGMWVGELGQEPSVELYISHLVEIFREVKRVLRHDGTAWVSIADSYAGRHSQGGPSKKQASNKGSWHDVPRPLPPGLKPKDLCLVPFRLAIALQNDGWWVRQDIIVSKNNPMPESVTSRCTKAHEYLFLLAKSEDYFFDHIAIQEDSIHAGEIITNNSNRISQMENYGVYRKGFLKEGGVLVKHKRNKRSVWSLSSQPVKDLHFATFPESLVEPCILAGTSAKGNCAKCGAPWKRIVETQRIGGIYKVGSKSHGNYGGQGTSTSTLGSTLPHSERTPKSMTTGWAPSCQCKTDEVIPALVLDPFMGCYDTKTEVLTKDGFKYFSSVVNNEIVATINLMSHQLEYQPIFQIHKYEYNGTMFHFTGKHTDLLVTPNHNMVVKKRYKDYFELVSAENIQLYDELLRECKWDGRKIAEFELPGTTLWKNQYSNSTLPIEVINMKYWVQFLGIYIAEGSISDTFIQITQTKKIKEITEILNNLPFKWKQYGKDFRICDKRLREYLKQFEKQLVRFIPEAIKSISKDYLQVLLESLMLGDGHKFTESSWHYYTISEKLADDVSEIALKCGWSVRIKERSPRNGKIRGRIIIGRHKQYEIHLSKKHGTPKVNHIKTVNYHGDVWCLSVPNKTLIVRRNGKIIISGNSGTTALVAKKLGRNYLGIELNKDYIDIAKKRLEEVSMPLFESVESSHNQLDLFK